MATQPPAADAEEDADVERLDADVCNVVGSTGESGSKWRLVVLDDLRDGERRFDELERSTGASSYTLSRELDDLVGDGFVENRKEFESPAASYCSLTEKGDALCPVLDSLDEWGEDWLE